MDNKDYTDQSSGFNFDLVQRNQGLEKDGKIKSKVLLTGTTIAGIIYKDGVVLGADTRESAGNIVSNPNCFKIHYIAPNIYCCGAGTAADTEKTTDMVSSQLTLHSYRTGREALVKTALTMLKRHLFKYQGYVSAALVLGGVDVEGNHIHTIYPHGSTDTLPYVTMGSGSLAAMSILESRYSYDLEEEAAKALMHDAICAGIFNDMGSGSNVDLCIINKEGATMLRNYDKAAKRIFRTTRKYKHPPIEILKEKVKANLAKVEVEMDVEITEDDA